MGLVLVEGMRCKCQAAPGFCLRVSFATSPSINASKASLECLKACKAARILDLGVGSGALLLAILKSLPNDAQGTGVDIDAGAVDACKENAQRLLNGEKAILRVVIGSVLSQQSG